MLHATNWDGSPWLHLLSEEELDMEVLLSDKREDGIVDCVEHLEGVGTDIVEEHLNCVKSFWRGAHGELLPSEFGCESHIGCL
jgi:hypothetical protein